MLRLLIFFAVFPGWFAEPVRAQESTVVEATYTSASDIPLTTAVFDGSGKMVDFTLSYAPTLGTRLTVVSKTSLGFIENEFDNLANGETVGLDYNGETYWFLAWYYGGDGNDLVLVPRYTALGGWGAGSFGQLGDGTKLTRRNPVSLVQDGVLAGKTVISVAAGDYHSLALCSDGTIAAWGWNLDGQLGDGTTVEKLAPVLVDRSGVLAGKTVVSLAAGHSHSLALCSDGTVAAWGNNDNGQLGDGTGVDRLTPVLIDQSGVLADKVSVSVVAGWRHSLVLCSDGTVAGWGQNQVAQLGDGTFSGRLAPVSLIQSGVLDGKTVVSLTAGKFHNQALCSDGIVAAWGWNSNGQLGGGLVLNQYLTEPALVDQNGVLDGKTVISLVAGEYFSMALCADGTIASWGLNVSGQLGDGTNVLANVPVLVDQSGVLNDKTPVSVAAGLDHALALCSDGTIASWGVNSFGQLGNGPEESNSNVPVLVDQTGILNLSVFSLASGFSQNLAAYGITTPDVSVEETGGAELTDGGAPIDFGGVSLVGTAIEKSFTVRNTGGSLLSSLSISFDGANAMDFRVTQSPASELAFGDSSVFTVSFQPGAVGPKTATLLLSSNDPDEDPFEITLTGTAGNRILPATYTSVADVPLSTPGFDGRGNTVNLSLAYEPILGTRLMVVSNTSLNFIEGEFDNLADGEEVGLDYDGTTYRFVACYYGGDGNDLVLVPRFTGLSAWGRNLYGGLGDGTELNRPGPVLSVADGVLAGKTVVSVSAGEDHSLALCSDGTLASWGWNEYGQLGDGTTVNRSEPVLVDQSGVLLGKKVVAVTTGRYHSVALCSDGTLASWGLNSDGQLGDATTVGRAEPGLVDPGGVLSGKVATSVVTGSLHNLALCSDGTLVSWGENFFGQLGDGTTTQSNAPVLVDRGGVLKDKSIRFLEAGLFHSMALCSDGTVASWGWNVSGQLGDGTITNRSNPVLLDQSGVLATRTILSLAAGSLSSMALCSDGTVAAWGENSNGELGDGSATDQLTPVLLNQSGVLAGKTIRSLKAGDTFGMVISADGTVAMWGINTFGQLGDGTTVSKSSPVLLDQSGVLLNAGVASIAGGASHSLALIEVAPEIAVDLAPVTELISGSNLIDFGETTLFGLAPVERTFTIRNIGSSDLRDVQAVFTGAQPFAFSVISNPPETISPGGNADFTVQFVPTNAGINSATLRIASNDRDENPFEIDLSGTAVSEFEWSEVEGAEYYNIYIQKDGALFQSFWVKASEGTSWMPAAQLPAGNYKWWVRSWTVVAGSTAWIEQPEFTYANVELISPEGTVSETRPLFEWTQSDHSRQVGTTPGYYNLYIQRNGALWKNLWIEGETNTTWQQPVEEGPMPPGNYKFWVNPWNQTNGVGIWSDPMECAIALPELIAPEGPLEEGAWTPEFSWTESESADWYQLYIQRNGGLFKAIWLEESTNTTHQEAEDMPVGEYKYWVNPWSFSGGFGPWIGPKEFSIGIPVPLTPGGLQTGGETQPLFTWTGSAKHEWYQIYLQRNGAYVADPWLPSNQVVNESWDISVANPDSIPANLILKLTGGDYRWWIRTYNAADGIGGWVEGPAFTIDQN